MVWNASSPKNVEAKTGNATMATGINRQCTVHAVEIRIAALSLRDRVALSIMFLERAEYVFSMYQSTGFSGILQALCANDI